MAYLRCESCGAKALVAASRCPRCATNFNLAGAGGGRLPLVRCRGCGIMHARGRACHWCPERRASAWRSPMVGIAAAAFLVAGASASSWRYRAELGSAYARAMERAPAPAAAITVAVAPAPAALPLVSAPTRLAASGDIAPPGTPPSAAAEAAVSMQAFHAAESPAASRDTIQWVPAVARTWVNVRNEAGRESQVVGIIRTGSRAMLGSTGRAGWRQVRSDSAIGWVNPKHFDVDSVRTSG